MAVDFGTLNFYGHVAAGDMKDTIRVLAFNTIRNLLETLPNDAEALAERIEGVVSLAVEMCNEIDEEVDHKKAEMDRITLEWEAKHAESDGNEASS